MVKKYLVIRSGKDKPHHAIKEIEKIISKNKECWFAKYGKPIDIKKITNNEKVKTYASIVIFEEKKLVINTYDILDASYETPKSSESYPSYYQINLVGTWVKLGRKSIHQPMLENLITKSSGRKILQTLRSSSQSFFYCWDVSI